MLEPLSVRVRDVLSSAVPFRGVCFRNVAPKFATSRDILSDRGSFYTGGRFNYKGRFGVLYLSCDVHTCMEETLRATQLGGFDVAKMLPRTLVGIEVQLSRVLDLTDTGVLHRLNISISDLTAPGWQKSQDLGQEAYTQQIGRVVYESGFEAILVPSAAMTGGRNLDVFMDRLQPDSRLHVIDHQSLLPSNPT